MAAMHQKAEQMASSVTDKVSRVSPNSRMRGDGFVGKFALGNRRLWICDKAALGVAVMLHLRSCYVSKAAILTVPVQPVPAENRSPA